MILREGTYAINLVLFVVLSPDRLYYHPLDGHDTDVFDRMSELISDRDGFRPVVNPRRRGPRLRTIPQSFGVAPESFSVAPKDLRAASKLFKVAPSYPAAPLPRLRSRAASQEIISAVARSSSQARWKRRNAAVASSVPRRRDAVPAGLYELGCLKAGRIGGSEDRLRNAPVEAHCPGGRQAKSSGTILSSSRTSGGRS